jgi:surfactin synthase thioesterase subunit
VAPHDGPFGRFLDMDDDELRETVKALATALGGRVDDSLLDMAGELLAADIEANKRYSWPAPKKLPCAVTTISWSADGEVPGALMGGWSECSDRVRHVELDGGHYEFLNAPAQLRELIHEDMLTPSP